MIGILDIGVSNLRSISNAIFSMGHDPVLITSAHQFSDLSHLIIPGVGAFPTAMGNIIKMEIKEAIQNFAGKGLPTLGICLGMQLLAKESDELSPTEGLGLIPGKVTKLNQDNAHPVPHVGWNTVEILHKHPVFKKIKPKVDFYFVHSYHFLTQDEADVLAKTEYGPYFNSIVGHKNIIGMQFHPEKSQANGLRLLENFCEWDGQC